MFVFDKLQTSDDGGFKETHNPICLSERDLCVEFPDRLDNSSVRWSFFGRCCVEEGSFDYFFMWVDKPLAHYQIVDLEDIFTC